MQFPVYLHVAGWSIPPHPILESFAYFVGFRVYLLLRKREKVRMPADKSLWILVGAVLGAAIGSKVLSLIEDPWILVQHITDPRYLTGGKTIVGGLLGGLIGVEWAKKRVGWTPSTGDTAVWPLIIGMCIGRVGCFLAGLPDGTYGTPTKWFTGVDFGDGIPRHPTQLYEIVFLLLLGLCIEWFARVRTRNRMRSRTRAASRTRADTRRRRTGNVRSELPDGARFQMFMVGYLAFRLLIEFIKPTPHPYFGLSNIQWASIFGILYYIPRLRTWLSSPPTLEMEAEHAQ